MRAEILLESGVLGGGRNPAWILCCDNLEDLPYYCVAPNFYSSLNIILQARISSLVVSPTSINSTSFPAFLPAHVKDFLKFKGNHLRLITFRLIKTPFNSYLKRILSSAIGFSRVILISNSSINYSSPVTRFPS